MKQLEIKFDETVGGISLQDLEKFHWPDPDAIVKQLASEADALDLFQDDDQPESLSIDELNKLFHGHGDMTNGKVERSTSKT